MQNSKRDGDEIFNELRFTFFSLMLSALPRELLLRVKQCFFDLIVNYYNFRISTVEQFLSALILANSSKISDIPLKEKIHLNHSGFNSKEVLHLFFDYLKHIQRARLWNWRISWIQSLISISYLYFFCFGVVSFVYVWSNRMQKQKIYTWDSPSHYLFKWRIWFDKLFRQSKKNKSESLLSLKVKEIIEKNGENRNKNL